MSKVKFIYGESSSLNSQPFDRGSLYLTTDDGKLYVDVPDELVENRILINKDIVQSGTEEYWNSQENFITEEGNIYIYIDKKINNQNGKIFIDFKIGDGVSALNELAFFSTVRGAGSGSENTNIIIDSELSDTSENPVQNKVVKAAIDAISVEAVLDPTGVLYFRTTNTVDGDSIYY